ncbi:hypothetical protein Bbelb_023210 [Branchiostoma belcheri]|nr:hypothetical protein Bbelb_023210 [Branchiostoma belcheri]
MSSALRDQCGLIVPSVNTPDLGPYLHFKGGTGRRHVWSRDVGRTMSQNPADSSSLRCTDCRAECVTQSCLPASLRNCTVGLALTLTETVWCSETREKRLGKTDLEASACGMAAYVRSD